MNVRTWILDPICGTTNYVKGLPFYTHAMSMIDNDRVSAAGIFNPCMNEMFLADRELTTLNKMPVKVSDVKKLNEAMIYINLNLSDNEVCQQELRDMVDLLAPPVTRRIRIMESANLELAYISCGRIDGYVNRDDKIWDMAAGSLMIASAGGMTYALKGDIHQLDCRGIAAGNKYIAPILKSMITKKG